MQGEVPPIQIWPFRDWLWFVKCAFNCEIRYNGWWRPLRAFRRAVFRTNHGYHPKSGRYRMFSRWKWLELETAQGFEQ